MRDFSKTILKILYIIPFALVILLIKVIVNNYFLLVPISLSFIASWLILDFKTRKWNRLNLTGTLDEYMHFISKNRDFLTGRFHYFLKLVSTTCALFLLISLSVSVIMLPQLTLSKTAYSVYCAIQDMGVSKQISYSIVREISKTQEINDDKGIRITSRAGARREILLNSDLPAEVKSYIDRNLIQQSDNKKDVDYSQPEMVRAIERYRDYTKDDDGKTNFEHFSENLSNRQKKSLSVTSESSKGSLARRMALLNDGTLTPEQKNKFDAEWLSEIPEQKPSKEHFEEIMKSEPGFTCDYETYKRIYNLISEQPTRNQALGALVSPPGKKPVPLELAVKIYRAFDLKKAHDYRDEDRFYASELSLSQREKCVSIMQKFGLSTVGHVYYFNKVMSSGGSKKKQQIQALIDIGFTKQQAEAYYDAAH